MTSDASDSQKPRLTGAVTDDTALTPAVNPVDETIGMEARQMLKSVRLPTEDPLPNDLREQVRLTVRNHIQQHKITYREVAKQIGAGESTISEVLKDTYKRASPDAVLRKLNTWIDNDERRRQKVRPIGFYPTCVFETIRGLAKYANSNARVPDSTRKLLAHDLPRIVVGWGPAGCGKSLGAQALHAEDTLSILVRVEQRRGTDTGLAKLIVESAGWRGQPHNQSAIELVMGKLRDSGRLLIVDEAHRLKTSGCEFLRDLADVCGIPILLLATQEFYHRLTRVRTRSGEFFYDQFSSRVGMVCDLLRGLDGKGGKTRPIYSIHEIRQIFKVDKVRLTTDAEEYLCGAACAVGLGMLRLAASIFEKALRSALRGSKVINARLLRNAAKSVLLPAGEVDSEVLIQLDLEVEQLRRFAQKRAAAG